MRTSFSRLCLILLAIGALALAGCGSDGDTGMQGPAGPPGEGPSAAEVEAAVAAALADQEPPDTLTEEEVTAIAEEVVADQEPVEIDTSEIEARIDALEEAGMAETVGLPILDDTATALTRDVNSLSQDASTYDVSLVRATHAAGASVAAGHYAGSAMEGFGGLDITDTGGDGADVFGSWLSDTHWGLIHTKSGRVFTNRVAVFSIGEQTGSNPIPRPGESSATWSGSMVGSWDEDERNLTTAEMAAHAASPNPYVRDVSGTNMIDLPGVNVRGTASLRVNFTNTATGPTATGTLLISGLSGDRGRFRPGSTMAGTNLAGRDDSYMVWTGMAIAAGDFSRRGFNYYSGTTAAGVNDGTYSATALEDIHDPSGATRYLAGRFYSGGGAQVGGVFMEDGQISGSDNVFGGTAVADDPDNVPDLDGILLGAFGAERVVP